MLDSDEAEAAVPVLGRPDVEAPSEPVTPNFTTVSETCLRQAAGCHGYWKHGLTVTSAAVSTASTGRVAVMFPERPSAQSRADVAGQYRHLFQQQASRRGMGYVSLW